MILPMPQQNGRSVAQSGEGGDLALFSVACRGMLLVMGSRPDPRGSCNSVFRYPSPFGWSCGVPSGSPVFCNALVCGGKTGEYAGTIMAQAGTRPAHALQWAPKRERGTGTCASQQQHSQSLHSSGFRPAATPLASKRSSARARAPQLRRWLAATLRPAPLWAARPTSSIAKNSPTSADRFCGTQVDLISPAATQPGSNPKPSTCASAAVAFLLPMQAAGAAREDQEGR